MSSLQGAAVRCPGCDSPLPPQLYNTEDLTDCPFCESSIRVIAFPALLKPVETGKTGDIVMLDGEASCFYHPEKKAVLTCNYCGRFLCSLCDVDLAGQHLCPPCIESGRKKKKLKNLENHRILYDDVALAVAILPIMFCYFVVFTAPIALYIAIRYWNAPGSIIPRTKVRFILAIIAACVEIVGVVVVVFFLITKGWK